jgi:hypothetical protein
MLLTPFLLLAPSAACDADVQFGVTAGTGQPDPDPEPATGGQGEGADGESGQTDGADDGQQEPEQDPGFFCSLIDAAPGTCSSGAFSSSVAQGYADYTASVPLAFPSEVAYQPRGWDRSDETEVSWGVISNATAYSDRFTVNLDISTNEVGIYVFTDEPLCAADAALTDLTHAPDSPAPPSSGYQILGEDGHYLLVFSWELSQASLLSADGVEYEVSIGTACPLWAHVHNVDVTPPEWQMFEAIPATGPTAFYKVEGVDWALWSASLAGGWFLGGIPTEAAIVRPIHFLSE